MPTTPNGVATRGLDPSFSQGMWRLISAVEKQGGNVSISSGVRSNAQQQELWNNRASNPNPVAEPGTSLHERGLAADLVGDQKTMALLHQLAPQFGLTGIAGDPVHFQLASTQSPSGSGLEPTTPQQGGPLSLSNRLDILASMLNPEGVSSSQMTQGIDPTAMTDTSSAMPTGQQPLSLTERLDAFGSMMGGTSSPPNSGGTIDKFMSAISGQESGGNYNAKNAGSGASGKYQIMPSNWSAWAKEAGLPGGSTMSPQNQEAVARFKMQQYYQQFGDWGLVAAAWFAGPGTAEKIRKNPSLAATVSDGNKSVQAYMDYAREHMGAN